MCLLCVSIWCILRISSLILWGISFLTNATKHEHPSLAYRVFRSNHVIKGSPDENHFISKSRTFLWSCNGQPLESFLIYHVFLWFSYGTLFTFWWSGLRWIWSNLNIVMEHSKFFLLAHSIFLRNFSALYYGTFIFLHWYIDPPLGRKFLNLVM